MQVTATIVFYLVICLLLVVLDIVVALLGLAFGGSFKVIFLKGLWALIVPTFLLVYGVVARHFPKVERVEIASKNLPKEFDGYRLVHISDLHVSSFNHNLKKMERVVKKINSQEGDIILFTGDLVSNSPNELNEYQDVLSGLKGADGVFSVLGNHDYLLYNRWDSENDRLQAMEELAARQKAMGWRLLLDENVKISRGDSSSISIIGVENTSAHKHFNSDGDLKRAMEGSDSPYKILLSHDPTHWRMEVLEKTDIDLMLSGHTHAIQFSIFGLCPSALVFDEYRGLYKEGEQMLYVNIGLGETGPLFRIGTPPEITVITLRSEP